MIVGQKHLIDRLLIALVTNGHVLLEGVPGLAKTLSLKTLAGCVDLHFQRLQFTPDMLPADIVGTMIYNPQDGGFRTKHGPIFSNLILADEINRAPAKVQSALLEAMQERQVTLGDSTYELPNPFLVLATQNPLEQEGTYPLPEAQVDRFMMKVIIGLSEPRRGARHPRRHGHERTIARRATGRLRRGNHPRPTRGQHHLRRRQDQGLHRDLVLATRDPKAAGLDLNGYIQIGASPRATINLTLAARAAAFLDGRGYVTPQDVKKLAPDVLRHRVAVSYEAEAENITSDDIIQKILDTLPVP